MPFTTVKKVHLTSLISKIYLVTIFTWNVTGMFWVYIDFILVQLVKFSFSMIELKLPVETLHKEPVCIAHNTTIYLKWVSTKTGCVKEGLEGMSKWETLSASEELIQSALDGLNKKARSFAEQVLWLGNVSKKDDLTESVRMKVSIPEVLGPRKTTLPQ